MSPTSSMKPRKTALPTGFYLVASIALFVFLMVFFIDLVTVIADMPGVELPLEWSTFGVFPEPLLTERMIVAVLLVVMIIMFFWSMDLIFTGRKRRN